MKFLIALISAANIASAIQLNNEFLFVLRPASNKKLPQQTTFVNTFGLKTPSKKNNKLTTMNFAETVMSKTFSNAYDYDWKRALSEHFYAGKPMFYAQQDTEPSTCQDVLGILQSVLAQKDDDVLAAFEGQYDEQGWNDLANLVC
jgi:hypothetical protein